MLQSFIARREKPSIIWSNSSSNFIGATCALIKTYFSFWKLRKHNRTSPSSARVKTFIGNSFWIAPSLWWALGGCRGTFKVYLRRVVGDARLTYDELDAVLTQIELDDNLEALAPDTFWLGGHWKHYLTRHLPTSLVFSSRDGNFAKH